MKWNHLKLLFSKLPYSFAGLLAPILQTHGHTTIQQDITDIQCGNDDDAFGDGDEEEEQKKQRDEWTWNETIGSSIIRGNFL